MKTIKVLFLEALSCSLRNQEVPWSFEISDQQWQQLFELAGRHSVLPMIYTAVQSCASIRYMDPTMLTSYRRTAVRLAALQTIKTIELIKLLHMLYQSGFHPLIVKGYICRELYPHPDDRASGDEDFIIPQHEFDACQSFLLAHGWQPADGKEAFSTLSDIAYQKENYCLRIELHPFPFAPESEIFGYWNTFFTAIHTNAEKKVIHGQTVYTMNKTDHLFFLICHALKHFLHSGFGIRQICDIALFANAYGSDIDWQKIFRQSQAVNAEYFVAAVFKIARKYLVFDPVKACCPLQLWQSFESNEIPLLKDILAAGLYGNASISRKHSSLMTLYVMQRPGQKYSLWTYLAGGVHLLFPSVLPDVWFQRWKRYLTDKRTPHPVIDGIHAIKIGKRRIGLMQQYKLARKETEEKGGTADACISDPDAKNKGRHFF